MSAYDPKRTFSRTLLPPPCSVRPGRDAILRARLRALQRSISMRRQFAAKPMQLAVVLALLTTFAGPAETCTRALYVGKDGLVITGRSMDWGEDMHSNLWVVPRGMSRDGVAGPSSVKWTSKYGSLAVSSYEAGTAGRHERKRAGDERPLSRGIRLR